MSFTAVLPHLCALVGCCSAADFELYGKNFTTITVLAAELLGFKIFFSPMHFNAKIAPRLHRRHHFVYEGDLVAV